jgi:hypothetical protein
MPSDVEKIRAKHPKCRGGMAPDFCPTCKNDPIWPCDVVRLADALENTLRILKECGPALLVAAIHGETVSPEVSQRNEKQIEEAKRTLREVAGGDDE